MANDYNWKDVQAPDFRGAAQGFTEFSKLLSQGLGGLQSGLTEFDNVKTDQINKAIALEALQMQDPEAAKAALADGSLVGKYDPRRVSAATLSMLGARPGQLAQQENALVDLGEKKILNGQRQAFDDKAPVLSALMAAYQNDDKAAAADIMAKNPGLLDGIGGQRALAFQGSTQDALKGAVGIAGDRQRQTLDLKEDGRADTRLSYDGRRLTMDEQRARNEQTTFNNAQTDRTEMRQGQAAVLDAFNNGFDAPTILSNITGSDLPPAAKLAAIQQYNSTFGTNLTGSAVGLSSSQTAAAQATLSMGGGGGIPGVGQGVIGSNGEVSAENLVKGYESFREKPYWDVNHHRVGYGSDTVTRADGTVVKTTPGMQVTRADADRDINRRMNNLRNTASQQGGQGWAKLGSGAQAAVLSVAYNYGDGSKRLAPLWKAVQAGDAGQVANVIKSFAGDNDGVNRGRRLSEAALATGSNNDRSVALRQAAVASQTQRVKDDAGRVASQNDPRGLIAGYSAAEGQKTFAIDEAKKLRASALPGVPQGWIVNKINEGLQASRNEKGEYTMNAAQVAVALKDSITKSDDDGGWISPARLIRNLTSPFAGSSNLAGGLRINDSQFASNIEQARSNKFSTARDNGRNQEQRTAAADGAQARAAMATAKFTAAQQAFNSGRTGVAKYLPQLEAEARQAQNEALAAGGISPKDIKDPRTGKVLVKAGDYVDPRNAPAFSEQARVLGKSSNDQAKTYTAAGGFTSDQMKARAALRAKTTKPEDVLVDWGSLFSLRRGG